MIRENIRVFYSMVPTCVTMTDVSSISANMSALTTALITRDSSDGACIPPAINLSPSDIKNNFKNVRRWSKAARLKTRALQVIEFTYARMVE